MLARLSDRLAAFFRATAPDPFVIAVLLTLATIGLALARTDAALPEILRAWAGMGAGDPTRLTGSGVWSLLGFAMQMCLVLVTGHVLASSAPVAWALSRLAALPRSGAQGAALVAGVSVALGSLHWGLGLIGGAFAARRVGQSLASRGIAAHYPLLAACGYLCMMIWHGGFSGTAPLSASTRAGLVTSLGASAAESIDPIPLSRTLFGTLNLVVTGGLIVIVPLLAALLHPRAGAAVQGVERFAPERPPAAPPANADDRPGLIPRVLENTPAVNIVLAAMIGWWAWRYYLPGAGQRSGIHSLSLDALNLTMLMLGLLLHATPRRFIAAVEDAAGGCAGIIIQFPLYAGIMGIMRDTGLAADLADSIAASSTAATLPLFTFLAAGVVNLFVPSGGGQWAIQGPIALDAARSLGVPPERMVMAIAYGDQITNMLQPFWALPLLAITGVKARDIIGYTALVMIAGMLWIGVWLVVLG